MTTTSIDTVAADPPLGDAGTCGAQRPRSGVVPVSYWLFSAIGVVVAMLIVYKLVDLAEQGRWPGDDR